MATGLPELEPLLREMLDTVAAGDDSTSRFERLRLIGLLHRLLGRESVDIIAGLMRDGEFAARGYKQPKSALANLLDIDSGEAGQLVTAAETVHPRTTRQGETLEPRLPATAAAFAAGDITVRHVSVVATVMESRAAGRLAPHVWAHAEEHVAKLAAQVLPKRLQAQATEYIELLDQDGDPDGPPPDETNELQIIRNPRGGGKIIARFDDPVRFETVLAVIDAKSAPLTADDQRTAAERQADALTDVFGFVAEHGDSTVLPQNRPTVAVIVQETDLENRAAAGCLAFGGIPSPAALRRMCCDANVIPVVLNGAGRPIDVGHGNRSIPSWIRRAVQVRDRGCAHPGCDRPPSWSECHHIIEWFRGGPTSVDNCVLLCRVHHREIHSTEWIVRTASDGIPEFVPPAWIDPEQRPRRHPRYLQPVG
jgi:hypothetical protein